MKRILILSASVVVLWAGDSIAQNMDSSQIQGSAVMESGSMQSSQIQGSAVMESGSMQSTQIQGSAVMESGSMQITHIQAYAVLEAQALGRSRGIIIGDKKEPPVIVAMTGN